MRFFRWLVVGAELITLLLTWQLWQNRPTPPLLPLLPLPAIDLGAMLIGSLLLILVRPKIGIALHTLLMLYALLIDQTRWQPQIISFLFLLWGTLPNLNFQMIARAHLIALWLWTGIHKLLSPGFLNVIGADMLRPILPEFAYGLLPFAGYVIATTELLTGILAILPRTRRLAGIMAWGLHMGIFLTLAAQDWNHSVYAWNVVLALSGFVFITTWRETPLKTLRQCRPLVRVIAILLVIMPAGFYVGIVDAYLAHSLYTPNTPLASSDATSFYATWFELGVPLPPEHRLFEQYFQRTCDAGDKLMIRDSRYWFVAQGQSVRDILCTQAPDS
jgi:hypothetical protein